MRVLIAEDEFEVAKALKILLERQRFSADIVNNGKDALDYLLKGNYDIAVLDIMMPEMDGLQVLTIIREKGLAVSVLLLTAKGGVEDRVTGLNAGADDYLPKPFAASEFLARIKALSRRVSAYIPDVLQFEDTQLDCSSYQLLVFGRSIRLNNKEFQMMELFMRNPHIVFSTAQLMERIWGYDSESNMDVVWTYIAFLRKKLKQLDAGIELRTIRGAGYALEKR